MSGVSVATIEIHHHLSAAAGVQIHLIALDDEAGNATAQRQIWRAPGGGHAEGAAAAGVARDPALRPCGCDLGGAAVFGDADKVVPWEENTGIIEERYKKLGGSITLIRKAGVDHHPHGLDDSTPIIEFITKHAATSP